MRLGGGYILDQRGYSKKGALQKTKEEHAAECSIAGENRDLGGRGRRKEHKALFESGEPKQKKRNICEEPGPRETTGVSFRYRTLLKERKRGGGRGVAQSRKKTIQALALT